MSCEAHDTVSFEHPSTLRDHHNFGGTQLPVFSNHGRKRPSQALNPLLMKIPILTKIQSRHLHALNCVIVSHHGK